MADFSYKNVSVTDAATLEEAKQLVAIAYLQASGVEEPTQQEIDALLAEIETEEAEGIDFDALEADITGELAWILAAQAAITNERAEIVTGIGIIDGGATLVQLRQVVRGLALIVDNTLQRQDRLTKQQQRELKAWRYVIRRL